MIFITGDTHADFARFRNPLPFPKGYQPSPEDVVIICGDFGGVWEDSPYQAAQLNRLSKLPYTVLFVDGNHENYDLLEAYPVTDWNGGRVRVIRDHVLHLTRGQRFSIDGKSFFTMGGAACHDIQNGVLDPADDHFESRFWELRNQGKFFRVRHHSWWDRELPTEEELEEGWRTLERASFQVDYVISHCAPSGLQNQMMTKLHNDTYQVNRLTDFLQRVYDNCSYSHWFCGHYHVPFDLTPKFHVLYEPVMVLPE